MMRETDMYGNTIYPLGETGFGVSLSFYCIPPDLQSRPYITVFHESDDFQQSLFSTALDPNRPYITDVFHKRIAEHFATEAHPIGMKRLREALK